MKKRYSIIKNLQIRLILFIFSVATISSLSAVFIISLIAPTDLLLFASLDYTIVKEIIHTIKSYNILALTIALSLVTIIVTIFSKKMLKPIRALSDATKKVAQGDFDVKLPLSFHKDDEFSILTDNFNKMTNELSSMRMLNNDFINNVSHEFKTPISSIQGFATVLLGTELTDDQREYAEIIATESARLSKLTSNVLNLTKLENQAIITDQQIFSLSEQIRHSILLIQNDWLKKNIEMDIDLNDIFYEGNPELIQQLWLNLLSNAIKFTNNYGKIIVKCYEENNFAIVSVKDNGIGMNHSTINHIYDKFYQGDKSHSSEGNGLGLSLVKRIIELCHGTIEVTSELEKGTEFIVKLPL